jgi:hypothetical protein
MAIPYVPGYDTTAHLRGMLATAKRITGNIVAIGVTKLKSFALVIARAFFPEHFQAAVAVVDIAMAPPAIREAVTDTTGARSLLVDQRSGVPASVDYADIVVLVDLAVRNPKTQMALAIVDASDAVKAFRTDFARYLAEHTVMKRMPSNFVVMGFDGERQFMGAFPALFDRNVQPGSSAALITDGKLPGVMEIGHRRGLLRVIGAPVSRQQTSAVFASAAELLKENTVQALMAGGFIQAGKLSGFNALLAELEVWSRAVTAMAKAA